MIKCKYAVFVVFTCVLARLSVLNAQGFEMPLPPENSSKFFLTERLWGTEWNGVGFNRMMSSEVFGGVWYEGWTDWNQVSAHIGTQKTLFVTEKGQAQTWTTLELSRQNWPVVHESSYKPLMTLGLDVKTKGIQSLDSLTVKAACRMTSFKWTWYVQSQISKGPNSVVITIGDTNYMQGWRAEYRYMVNRLAIVGVVEGVNPSYSVGLIYIIKSVNYSIRHRSRLMGGSTEMELSW